eukprot:GHRR01008496.1.p1 GENE.GHRR01008496.1~~GHRR01008496.1.p1  ORF type:complete len:130 (-),score=14.61 GHRR01008496.1:79-468(-)
MGSEYRRKIAKGWLPRSLPSLLIWPKAAEGQASSSSGQGTADSYKSLVLQQLYSDIHRVWCNVSETNHCRWWQTFRAAGASWQRLTPRLTMRDTVLALSGLLVGNVDQHVNCNLYWPMTAAHDFNAPIN